MPGKSPPPGQALPETLLLLCALTLLGLAILKLLRGALGAAEAAQSLYFVLPSP